jgi:NAD(P)-dependent dehydrogenase (short-subunit alcohol dehydrogenase family)
VTLAGQHVVVIGGTAGIGLATARAAASAGAIVTVASRNPDSRGNSLDGFNVERCDISESASVASLFEGIDNLNHLVVTAAEMEHGHVLDADLDLVNRNFTSRFWGSVAAVRAAVPKMPSVGSITLTSGNAVDKAFPGEAFPGASAGAVEALMRTLAVEIAPIRVNVLCPGFIDTSLLDFLGEERNTILGQIVTTRMPVGRIGTPEDVAHAALFLMTNGYVTGLSLLIDGGYQLT